MNREIPPDPVEAHRSMSGRADNPSSIGNDLSNLSTGWKDLGRLLHPPAHVLPDVPGYTVLRLLGEGGMGAVYEAQRAKPRHTVAIKLLRPEITHGLRGDELLKRFEREIEILARLQHPCIAHIYEQGIANTPSGPTPYLAMELVSGANLVSYAYDAGLKINARLELLARVADGVHHAHERGVVHRDLKPGNILVGDDGQPKVLDFGIASFSGSDLAITTVQQDVPRVIGTLRYMSPEQAGGDLRQVGPHSDVYSLGVILFELLTGMFPHDLSERGIADAIRIIRDEEPTRLSSLNATLRGDIDTIVATALAREPARRYASAAALADDLRRYLADQPILARRPSAAYRARKFVARNRILVSSIAVVMVILASALLVSLSFYRQALRENAAKSVAESETAAALGQERRTSAENNRLLRESLRQAARLASERGAWTEALRAYDAALAAGYADEIEIQLGRHTALEGLLRSDEADELLSELAARPNLGKHLGMVRLRVAERALSNRDPTAYSQLENAIAASLPRAEAEYAKGLLAETLPKGLAHFEAALQADSTHRNAMGLRSLYLFCLGRLGDARRQISAAVALYPSDASLLILEALAASFDNDPAAAQTALARLRERQPGAESNAVAAVFQIIAELPPLFADMPLISGGSFVKYDRHPEFDARTKALTLKSGLALLALGNAELDGPSSSSSNRLRLVTESLGLLSQKVPVDSTVGEVIQVTAGTFGFPRALENIVQAVIRLAGAGFSVTGVQERVPELRQIGEDNRLPFFFVLAGMGEFAVPGMCEAATSDFDRALDFPAFLDLRRPALFYKVVALMNIVQSSGVTPERSAQLRDAIRRLMEVQPLSLGEALQCAGAALRIDSLALARQLLDRVAELDRENPFGHLFAAELEYRSGAYGEAIRHADAVLRLQPNEAAAISFRTLALERLGKIGRGDEAVSIEQYDAQRSANSPSTQPSP